MSCLGKLFIPVLNNRLLLFSIQNKILSDSRLRFLAGNRTSDGHIILNNIVRKHCYKNSTKIFSCLLISLKHSTQSLEIFYLTNY